MREVGKTDRNFMQDERGYGKMEGTGNACGQDDVDLMQWRNHAVHRQGVRYAEFVPGGALSAVRARPARTQANGNEMSINSLRMCDNEDT